MRSLLLFVLWGHASSWMAFWLCSFSVTFDTPYHQLCLKSMQRGHFFKVCAGRHIVFCSECWAKKCKSWAGSPSTAHCGYNTDEEYETCTGFLYVHNTLHDKQDLLQLSVPSKGQSNFYGFVCCSRTQVSSPEPEPTLLTTPAGRLVH